MTVTFFPRSSQKVFLSEKKRLLSGFSNRVDIFKIRNTGFYSDHSSWFDSAISFLMRKRYEENFETLFSLHQEEEECLWNVEYSVYTFFCITFVCFY